MEKLILKYGVPLYLVVMSCFITVPMFALHCATRSVQLGMTKIELYVLKMTHIYEECFPLFLFVYVYWAIYHIQEWTSSTLVGSFFYFNILLKKSMI